LLLAPVLLALPRLLPQVLQQQALLQEPSVQPAF
jgi:hypothetical protein